MSAAPRLVDVLDEHHNLGGVFTWACDCGADSQDVEFRGVSHSEHQAAVWREVCTIHTAEQLDALPTGAVVWCRDRVDVDGDMWGAGSWQKSTRMASADGSWFWWAMDYGDPAGEVPLPALLVWHPDWEVAS